MDTPSITVTANPPTDVTSPTMTHYQQLAADFMKAISAIAAVIPPLDPDLVSTAKFIRGHQNIPDKFCATTVDSVEQVPALQGVGALDTVAGRDTLQFLEAFRPALDTGDAVLKDLHFTLMARKAALASQSLQIYGVARTIARDPLNTHVKARFADMKRDLGRPGLTKAQRELRKAAKLKAAEDAAAQKEVETA